MIKKMFFSTTFFGPQEEKNSVQHGKNINITRVIVALALLGHQTSHSQD